MADETLTCTIEAPTPMASSISAALSASFYEVGGTAPTSIIRSDQASRVAVKIDFSASDLARAFCIRWCVKLAFEGCGTAPDEALPVRWVDQKVCETQTVAVTFDIPAGHFPTGAGGGCGDVYGLCVTVVAFDGCGKPLPFAGFCKGGTIMVFPA